MVPDGKGHWISEGDLIFVSPLHYKPIVVPKGSVNDLASIPWFFRRVFPINGPSRPAAALHDYLYETKGLNGKLSREKCDKIFKQAMLVPRYKFWDSYDLNTKNTLREKNLHKYFLSAKPLTNKFTANLMYYGVRAGGGSYFNK